MNFIQRAFKYVKRRMSRTVLLALTFFLIGNLVIIGLGISEASKTAKVLTRQKMRAVVTYSVDYEAISKYIQSIEDEDVVDEFYENYPKVKLDDVRAILLDERVKTANAISTNMVYDVDGSFDFVHLNNGAEENIGNTGQSCYLDEDNNERCTSYVEPKFALKGNYFPDMIEFADGTFTMVDGRFYTQEEIDEASNVIVITEELAETNGVRVGDTIELRFANINDYSYYGDDLDISDISFDVSLEVIGIYAHKAQITPDNSSYDWTYPYENPSNMMLLPATTYENTFKELYQRLNEYYYEKYGEETDYATTYISNVTILLNDPLEVDGFVEDYNATVSQFMKLDANNEEFNKLAKPLDTLSLYANFIVSLVIFNAIVIITLVTALTLKTREYEIGVLLSIGATKVKIIAQFFIELALVAVLGFTLAVGSGSLIANKVGQTVLEYQIASSDVEEEDDYYYDNDYINIWDNDYSTDISLEDLISEYSVSISPIIIGEIYVLGLGIVLISVIIPSFMIMRFNPKKILMNQG